MLKKFQPIATVETTSSLIDARNMAVVVVAAKEGDELLHEAFAIGALHLVRYPTSSGWELESTARVVDTLKLVMVVLKRKVVALGRNMFLPDLVLVESREHGVAVAVDHQG